MADHFRYFPPSRRYPERRRSLEDRFWEKVTKGDPDDCWLWKGSTNHQFYGTISKGGDHAAQSKYPATHASWLIHHGELPAKGMVLLHTCDNPPCVNPAHLQLGTQSDNMQDCSRKGRMRGLTARPGILNNHAKLTWEAVAEIRAAYNGGETLSRIAMRLKMARSTLREIVNGRNWQTADTQTTKRLPPTFKLTSIQTARILARLHNGHSARGLGTEFGVSWRTIDRIVKAYNAERNIAPTIKYHRGPKPLHRPSEYLGDVEDVG